MSTYRWRAPLLRVLKYGGIDTVLFPLNLGVAWALTTLGVNYQLATFFGFFVHVTIAFFANRRWTFHANVNTSTGLWKTWLIATTDLALAVGVTTLLVERFGLAFVYARTGAAFVVFVWDYALNSVFTFKAKIFS